MVVVGVGVGVGAERLQTANKRTNAKLKFNHRPPRLGLGPTVVWPFCNVYQVQPRAFSSDKPLLNRESGGTMEGGREVALRSPS